MLRFPSKDALIEKLSENPNTKELDKAIIEAVATAFDNIECTCDQAYDTVQVTIAGRISMPHIHVITLGAWISHVITKAATEVAL